MASNSVGLASGSPPPLRAATSMFLISLAKSLPRLASTAAFLCLVVAHLEWPDIVSILLIHCPTHQVGEVLVHTDVARQLRVEGRGHQPPLTDRNDPTGVVACFRDAEHLDLAADALDPRGPDEDRIVGPAGD